MVATPDAVARVRLPSLLMGNLSWRLYSNTSSSVGASSTFSAQVSRSAPDAWRSLAADFWRQETEPPLQQAFQDRALPLDATLLHAFFARP